MPFNWFKKKDSQQLSKDGADQTSQPAQDVTNKVDEPKASATKLGIQSSGEGFFHLLKKGLAKTRQILTTDIEDLFTGKRKIDSDFLEDLEELLITSDIGIRTTTALIETISKQSDKITSADELKEALKAELLKYLNPPFPPKPIGVKPYIIMVVGVNGVGKTTTIGKLAARFRQEHKKVLIAAADTFRAAAVEQLSIWAERAGVEIIRHKDHADPSAVVFDSLEAAIARQHDIVIIDTAGRLHTKVNLMEELKKIQRTVAKRIPDAPHETLLVLDATTGQNAISQAKLFHEAIGVTGIALTKLDGTAKGGIVVSICNTMNIPIRYIGVGEHIEDLQDFNPEQFVKAMFDK